MSNLRFPSKRRGRLGGIVLMVLLALLIALGLRTLRGKIDENQQCGGR